MIDLETILTRAREAKARADAATEGPWTSANGIEGVCIWEKSTGERLAVLPEGGHEDRARNNAQFVVAARTDVPLLAQDVEALVAAVRRRNCALIDAAMDLQGFEAYARRIDLVCQGLHKAIDND